MVKITFELDGISKEQAQEFFDICLIVSELQGLPFPCAVMVTEDTPEDEIIVSDNEE